MEEGIGGDRRKDQTKYIKITKNKKTTKKRKWSSVNRQAGKE